MITISHWEQGVTKGRLTFEGIEFDELPGHEGSVRYSCPKVSSRKIRGVEVYIISLLKISVRALRFKVVYSCDL